MKKFNPLNELEWSLLAAQESKISVEIFLQKFVRSVLALPTAKKVQEDGSGFEPVLFDKLGINMLAAFTDKARASHLADIARYCLEMNGEPEQTLREIASEGYSPENPIAPARFEEYANAIVALENQRGELRKYMGAVKKLRDAGKSYRAIAGMLHENGVDVSYSELWRTYKIWSGMSSEEQLAEEESEEHHGS